MERRINPEGSTEKGAMEQINRGAPRRRRGGGRPDRVAGGSGGKDGSAGVRRLIHHRQGSGYRGHGLGKILRALDNLGTMAAAAGACVLGRGWEGRGGVFRAAGVGCIRCRSGLQRTDAGRRRQQQRQQACTCRFHCGELSTQGACCPSLEAVVHTEDALTGDVWPFRKQATASSAKSRALDR